MSVKRFSLSSQRQLDTDFDHLIILQDNTQPANPALSRATTNNISDSNASPDVSAPVSRVQSIASLPGGHSRTNTAGTIGSFNSIQSPTSPTGYAPGHKRKESLRKHLAERKYHRNWKQEQNNINGELSGKSSSNSSEDSSTDEDSDRSNTNSKDGRKIKKTDTRHSHKDDRRLRDFPTVVLTKKDEIQSKGTKALRKAKQVGRRVRKEELVDDVGELDILYENQRGTFFFGIPMFSAKSLLPVDSAPWTNRHHAPSAVNIFNAQVPDPSWVWAWKSFAVDMTGDVDEEGWQYSFAFRGTKWHGNAVWWHGFVRRRRWIRKRVKRRLPVNVDEAHGLTPEYFTIHSHDSIQNGAGGYYYPSSIRSIERNAKLEEYPTATFESDDSELEDFDIQDIPSLIKAFKMARLDREKIEALNSFLQYGGGEVAYLADSMPQIMRSMIFQQSRRKVLSILLETLTEAKDKRREREGGGSGTNSPNGKPVDFNDDDEKRFIDGLGRAVDAGEAEVRKLEFWSDIKKAQHAGYAGVENAPDYGKDMDESDYEYADIWKARGRFINQRKEQMSGKARGEFAERDETDRSTLASRGTDGGGPPPTAKEKGKGKAED
ncbi:hypothetical protein ABW19_dt0202216 [Dactylella cylindrospora]|nr:hypothetical protein ABW19_dt0202216 [Dactylella cylindrospora]